MSDVNEVAAVCQNPPCPLGESKTNQEWANRVRAHFASGDHSGDRPENAMFVRIMEKEFRRAMGIEGAT